MSSSTVIVYEAPTANISIRIRLLPKENPEVVAKVLQQIDLTGELVSTCGHVVISGEGIWLPTRIVYLGAGNMVKRTPGTVYFYAPGQIICLTYGRVTESSPVNKFAHVFEEDLPKLEALGKFVHSKTIMTAQRTPVPVKLRRYGTPSPLSVPAQIVATPEFKGHWTEAVTVFETEISRIWTEMPTDVRKIDLGISNTGAGTGGQMFSVLVHAEAYAMMTGADILYRFMKSTQDKDMTVPLLKRMTRDFLLKPFNIPEFMTDLGLENMHKFGDIYVEALETVSTFDEYILLTGALLTYFTHRWIHYIFPWHLGPAFPHRDEKELIVFLKSGVTLVEGSVC
jgi:Cucumopine synthase C-terminal helical bundle domain